MCAFLKTFHSRSRSSLQSLSKNFNNIILFFWPMKLFFNYCTYKSQLSARFGFFLFFQKYNNCNLLWSKDFWLSKRHIQPHENALCSLQREEFLFRTFSRPSYLHHALRILNWHQNNRKQKSQPLLPFQINDMLWNAGLRHSASRYSSDRSCFVRFFT